MPLRTSSYCLLVPAFFSRERHIGLLQIEKMDNSACSRLVLIIQQRDLDACKCPSDFIQDAALSVVGEEKLSVLLRRKNSREKEI